MSNLKINFVCLHVSLTWLCRHKTKHKCNWQPDFSMQISFRTISAAQKKTRQKTNFHAHSSHKRHWPTHHLSLNKKNKKTLPPGGCVQHFLFFHTFAFRHSIRLQSIHTRGTVSASCLILPIRKAVYRHKQAEGLLAYK